MMIYNSAHFDTWNVIKNWNYSVVEIILYVEFIVEKNYYKKYQIISLFKF